MMSGARVKVQIRASPTLKFAKFRRLLPKGKTETGGYREDDLVQFYVGGGLKTVRLDDILAVR